MWLGVACFGLGAACSPVPEGHGELREQIGGGPFHIRGSLHCGQDTTYNASIGPPLRETRLTLTAESGFTATLATDADGRFAVDAPFDPGPRLSVHVEYDQPVILPGGFGQTEVRVVEDAAGQWPHDDLEVVTPAVATVAGTDEVIIQLGAVSFSSAACEVFRVVRRFAADYHQVRGTTVPGGDLMFVLRTAVVFGFTPWTPYDYVEVPGDILERYPPPEREQILFHEAAHVVRDVLDGDLHEWNWDSASYVYGSGDHSTRELRRPGYAFHEGWANFWMRARADGRSRLGGPGYPDTFRDWNEGLVANRLLELTSCFAHGGDANGAPRQIDFDRADALLLQALENNPGRIHTLHELERALCSVNDCCGLARPAPPPCPPGLTETGGKCKGVATTLKPTYRRIPLAVAACPGGTDLIGKLCYAPCPSDLVAVGTACVGGRDVPADTRSCSWFDSCGFFDPSCALCPGGTTRNPFNGCMCSPERASAPPPCPTPLEPGDDGECYAACRFGHSSGSGGVCLGQCPSEWTGTASGCTYGEEQTIRIDGPTSNLPQPEEPIVNREPNGTWPDLWYKRGDQFYQLSFRSICRVDTNRLEAIPPGVVAVEVPLNADLERNRTHTGTCPCPTCTCPRAPDTSVCRPDVCGEIRDGCGFRHVCKQPQRTRQAVARLARPYDHFYTRSYDEYAILVRAGIFSEEAFPYFFTKPESSAETVAIYRCLLPDGRHLYSNFPDCEGAGAYEDVLGYASALPDPSAPSLPLYRLRHTVWDDRLLTTNLYEAISAIVSGGFVLEGSGVLGWVWSDSGESCSRLTY